MERDFLDVNQKTEEQLCEERKAWAAREASIVLLAVIDQFKNSNEIMGQYAECRQLCRAIAEKALLKGYEFGYDHGYAAQRMIARTPQATGENDVEEAVFRWLTDKPAMKVVAICKRLSQEGYPLPVHLSWAAKLRRYAEELQQVTDRRIDPWLAWRESSEEERAGLDAWLSEMRHKAKCIRGARKLTKASKDCVMPRTPIWGAKVQD
jgi:hypothetical protein